MVKKGEVQQVFIYLMVIIVVGIVFLLGYSAISSLIGKGCDVEKTNFLTAFNREISRYERPGSSALVELSAPCSYDVLCFVNSSMDSESRMHQVIRDNLDAGTGINIFIGEGRTMEPFQSKENLEVQGGFLCINSTARNFNFRVTGVGRGMIMVSAN